MTLPDLANAVMQSIRIESPPDEVRAFVEHGGDEAFDMIRDLINGKSLKDTEIANALGRLFLVTRHQCQYRREEIVRIALALMESPSAIVRSRACNAAIGGVQILEHGKSEWRTGSFAVGHEPSMREQVQSALKQALARGLDSEEAKHVTRFLSNQE